MLTLEVTTHTGDISTYPLPPGQYSIGKGGTCDIVLADSHISRHHINLTISSSGLGYLEDAGSTNGVEWNGKRIKNRKFKVGERFSMGNLKIKFVTETPTPLEENSPARKATVTELKPTASAPITPAPKAAVDPARLEKIKDVQKLKQFVQDKVLEYLDLHKRGVLHKFSSDELKEEAREAAKIVIKKDRVEIPGGYTQDLLIEEIVCETIGLGPLEVFLEDDSVTEIMVNGADSIYVEKEGKLTHTTATFASSASLMSAIERIVSPLGRRIDEGSPMVDARLADGSRVNAIIPPLALNGPTLTIRKFAKEKLTMQNLIEFGTLSPEMAEFLEICVKTRKNMIVSGGTGSGKTTTLNILSNFIPENERIVTIEDAAELQLHQAHVVSLESRPPNIEGKGKVAIRDLLKNSLRMRPDRIVVGECRGGEALDMLQAMNTGHDGSLTTGHANTPRDLLSRLEVMVLMSGIDLPVRAVREQVTSAVDIILQQTRFSDGKRRITNIVEIDGMEKDVILMQSIFSFKETGRAPDGGILGEFAGTGYAPSFYRELELSGMKLDRSIFGEHADV